MTPKDIRRLRLQMHLTQAQMAEELGCTRVHISNLERGLYRPGQEVDALLQRLETQTCPTCGGTGIQEIKSASSSS